MTPLRPWMYFTLSVFYMACGLFVVVWRDAEPLPMIVGFGSGCFLFMGLWSCELGRRR